MSLIGVPDDERNFARRLPEFQTTPIEFTPDKAGEFTFTCGMNMMRGTLVVEPA